VRGAQAWQDQLEQALRLNSHPPGWYYWFLGQGEYLDCQYERAVQSLRREESYSSLSRRTLAAALAKLGRREEAKREAERFMISNPHFTISGWARVNCRSYGSAADRSSPDLHRTARAA
jgi:hypothetical protein